MKSRGSGRLFQRPGSIFWWCAYSVNQKEVRESTKQTNPVKAQEYLDYRVRHVKNQSEGIAPFVGPRQEKITVDELLDDLIAEYKHGGKEDHIPRKVPGPMLAHLKRVRTYFGKWKALQVQKSHVWEFIDKLRGEGKQDSTIEKSLALLRQTYKIAMENDPPKLTRMPKVPKLNGKGRVRQGKFLQFEVAALAASLPAYLTDLARFAYESGHRKGEICKLKWSYVGASAIRVPGPITKNRFDDAIVLSPELREIVDRRRLDQRDGCDLIFHHAGKPIVDFRRSWQTACIAQGLGGYYCRTCRGDDGQYISRLDANRTCPKCGRTWTSAQAKYVGSLFHDFRRSAAHEVWLATHSIQEAMRVTGHRSEAMAKRYVNLFSDQERQEQQRLTQQRRSEWREQQLANMASAQGVIN
jgi:integrase